MNSQQLDEAIERLAHWLPRQGPIKEFIHHNTLHAYQRWPFFEGLRRASRMLGSRSFLRLDEYRERLRGGLICPEILAQVAGEFSLDREQMLNYRPLDSVPTPGIAWTGLRSRWRCKFGLRIESHTHPVLFRWVGQYLDQGVAIWRMPHVHLSLFQAVMKITRESWLPVDPYSKPCLRPYYDMDSHRVVLDILNKLIGRPEYYERYLLEMSLAHPGWSGMIRSLEQNPENLVLSRKVSLVDFMALELMAELAYIQAQLGTPLPPLLTSQETLPLLPVEADYPLRASQEERLQEAWQIAYERTYAQNLLSKVVRQPLSRSGRAARVSAFFCIDDRECSLRRHLEFFAPDVQTFGTAGFFAIDCAFQGADHAFPFKHCPAPMTPRHLIREFKTQPEPRTRVLSHWMPTETTLLRGFLVSQTLGLWAALRLAFSVFWPSFEQLTAPALSSVSENGVQLQVERDPQEATRAELAVGYTDLEMADRVGSVLQATGALSRGLGELVILLGHGASSVNNPYFAAYDCGACSGKAGAPNARAFALMANRAQVRELLKLRGLGIPETCWFVGALHDTTRDEVRFFDCEQVPPTLQGTLDEFREKLKLALGENARERCQKFALVSSSVDSGQALREVRQRSEAIFEPRPELNHANNAACIVGGRELSKGLMLDRRVFLNSYDPGCDPEGETLAKILGAVVPVCGGINLEYFFSRIDPRVYGSGSKLPHNVNGLIGVINGTQGDLLTGLPTQMTELHEPLRLLLLVQHHPQIALSAAQANPEIFNWIENGWIQYFSLAPGSQQTFHYTHSQMRPLEFSEC